MAIKKELEEFRKIRRALERIAKAQEEANDMDRKFYELEYGMFREDEQIDELSEEDLSKYIL